MRIFDAGTLALLAARGGLVAHRLIWISARNRATQAVEAMGLWSGEDDITISIDGEARTYQGAGAFLQTEATTSGMGLAVRIHQIGLSAVAPEVEALVKQFETRFAPVAVHRALFNAETRELVGAPHRVFLGMINSIDFPRAADGGAPAAVLDIASETRTLTRTLGLKKSDDSQKRRAGDRFRRYGDISGSVPVYWGELKAAAPADPAPEAPVTSQETNEPR